MSTIHCKGNCFELVELEKLKFVQRVNGTRIVAKMALTPDGNLFLVD